MKPYLAATAMAATFAIGLAGCSSSSEPSSSPSDAVSASASESNGAEDAGWSYSGVDGPQNWGSLSPAYAACSSGKEQSPIDLQNPQVNPTTELVIDYEASALEWFNTGHTLEAQFEDPKANSTTIDGTKYNLVQTHFHTPSEHEVDGSQLAMEQHFVHMDAAGDIAVLGVLINQGSSDNKAFDELWSSMPTEEGDRVALEGVDPAAMLPSQKAGTYRYQGSFTTPPCTEGVKWFVMEEPIELSSKQIGQFRDIYSDNARPVQPLNDRTLDATNDPS